MAEKALNPCFSFNEHFLILLLVNFGKRKIVPSPETIASVKRSMVESAIRAYRTLGSAARALGISRSTLHRYIKKWNLDSPRGPGKPRVKL